MQMSDVHWALSKEQFVLTWIILKPSSSRPRTKRDSKPLQLGCPEKPIKK